MIIMAKDGSHAFVSILYLRQKIVNISILSKEQSQQMETKKNNDSSRTVSVT